MKHLIKNAENKNKDAYFEWKTYTKEHVRARKKLLEGPAMLCIKMAFNKNKNDNRYIIREAKYADHYRNGGRQLDRININPVEGIKEYNKNKMLIKLQQTAPSRVDYIWNILNSSFNYMSMREMDGYICPFFHIRVNKNDNRFYKSRKLIDSVHMNISDLVDGVNYYTHYILGNDFDEFVFKDRKDRPEFYKYDCYNNALFMLNSLTYIDMLICIVDACYSVVTDNKIFKHISIFKRGMYKKKLKFNVIKKECLSAYNLLHKLRRDVNSYYKKYTKLGAKVNTALIPRSISLDDKRNIKSCSMSKIMHYIDNPDEIPLEWLLVGDGYKPYKKFNYYKLTAVLSKTNPFKECPGINKDVEKVVYKVRGLTEEGYVADNYFIPAGGSYEYLKGIRAYSSVDERGRYIKDGWFYYDVFCHRNRELREVHIAKQCKRRNPVEAPLFCSGFQCGKRNYSQEDYYEGYITNAEIKSIPFSLEYMDEIGKKISAEEEYEWDPANDIKEIIPGTCIKDWEEEWMAAFWRIRYENKSNPSWKDRVEHTNQITDGSYIVTKEIRNKKEKNV